jgi:hypothetical protein
MGIGVWIAARVLIPAGGAGFIEMLGGVLACVVSGLAIFGICCYGIKSQEFQSMLAEIKMGINKK